MDQFTTYLSYLLLLAAASVSCFIILVVALRFYVIKKLKPSQRDSSSANVISVGFFHPYCNAGGGGERVLWCAIQALQSRYPQAQCAVYTGDAATPQEIIKKVKQQFNITLPADSVKFIYLKNRWLVETRFYPVATLLGQSIGSKFLGLEALFRHVPDIYIDSMGYAFTIPIFRYLGDCQVSCYVHYPTISTDMLERVSQGIQTYNNRSTISQSGVLTSMKKYYYRYFACLYGFVGRCCHVVMVNSRWTKGHIVSIWGRTSSRPVFLVYPPCDISDLEKIPIEQHTDDLKTIVSVAQFRPEKDHALQIKAFALMMKRQPPEVKEKINLILVGSCRDEEDESRVAALKELSRGLGVSDYVRFEVNVPYDQLKNHLQRGTIGLHTMWNEHFGISVVECMAAGLVMLAHNSGGPKMDIVVDNDGKPTGFLAETEEEFANNMAMILSMDAAKLLAIRQNARRSVQRFKQEEFAARFLRVTEPLFMTLSED